MLGRVRKRTSCQMAVKHVHSNSLSHIPNNIKNLLCVFIRKLSKQDVSPGGYKSSITPGTVIIGVEDLSPLCEVTKASSSKFVGPTSYSSAAAGCPL